MNLLTVKNMSLHLLGNKVILDNINFAMQPQDFIILLGNNGSGKSTFMKLLYRHYHHTSGEINFYDKPIMDYSQNEIGKSFAILTQHSAESLFTSLSILENFLIIKKIYDLPIYRMSKEREILKNYLNGFNSKLAKHLNLPVAQLSGGEMQTLALALCLYNPPKLLLLDEHTSALDPKTSEQIMSLTQAMITKHHISCILTTHDLDIALKYGNRILMLQDGKVKHEFTQEEKLHLTRDDLLHVYY